MSRWVVLFEDTAQMIEHRKKQGTKHAQYALTNKDEILLGGGFRETPDRQFVGGMWVMQVSSRERAVELIENDPYYHGEYRKYKLNTWGNILEKSFSLALAKMPLWPIILLPYPAGSYVSESVISQTSI